MSKRLGTCTITRCDLAATWEVAITGHPNVPGPWKHGYCTVHASERAGTIWDESPTPYTITVRGPFPVAA